MTRKICRAVHSLFKFRWRSKVPSTLLVLFYLSTIVAPSFLRPDHPPIAVKIIGDLPTDGPQHTNMRQHGKGKGRHSSKKDQIENQESWLYIRCEYIAKYDQAKLDKSNDENRNGERAQVVAFQDEVQAEHACYCRSDDRHIGYEMQQIILLVV